MLPHALVRDARFSFPLRVWMEEVPPNIYCYVVRDLPLFFKVCSPRVGGFLKKKKKILQSN